MLTMLASIFLFVMICSVKCAVRDQPQAFTPAGTFLGLTGQTTTGKKFDLFLGIRYAEPPVGNLSFEEPRILKNSPDDVFNATEEGSDCIQVDPIDSPEEVTGNDDCLFLNVYTPQGAAENCKEALPVVVWIHGGLWSFGSGKRKMYGPEHLLDEDVVLVAINYRLGLFGFASLEDNILPGNLGIKDQKAAILWVIDNINGFCGDPQKITLFGHSAGAASVHFHMLNPKTEGLIQAGISNSGTAFAPWAIAARGVMREKTLELAKDIGCSNPRNDSQQIIDCFKSRNGKDIMDGYLKSDILQQFSNPFRPTVEQSNPNSYIRSLPWENTEPTTKPWLLGYTSAEAAFIYLRLLPLNGILLRTIQIQYRHLMPKLLMLEGLVNDTRGLLNKVKDHYFPEGMDFLDNPKPFINVLCDGMFVYPIHRSLEFHKGDTYLYYYDHKGKTGVTKKMGSDADLGVSHGDDIPYLFKNHKIDVFEEGSDEDKAISHMMVKLWMGFVKHGQNGPGISWPKRTKDNPKLLYIGSTDVTSINESQIANNNELWENLMKM